MIKDSTSENWCAWGSSRSLSCSAAASQVCPPTGCRSGDLQGQVPLLTQSSNSKLRTMSEPVPVLRPALDPLASRVQGWMGLMMDTSLPCDSVKQIEHKNSDMAPETVQDQDVSDQSGQTAKNLKHCRALSCQQEDRSATEVVSATDGDNCNHLLSSVNSSEDCCLDLRIVKHKPSAIVFCDHDCSSDKQVTLNESSDTGESSSLPTTEEGERQDNSDEDDFPQTLQYKEFLVSHRRRVLNRNRKSLRKRLDAHPKSTTSGWRKSTGEGKPEFTGGQEEREAGLNNGKQVRQYKTGVLITRRVLDKD